MQKSSPPAKTVRKKQSNDQRVLHVLQHANGPLTAYQILDHLKPYGISGPTIVYRSLNKLMALGEVHRIETLNAYVQCRDRHHCAQPVFVICEECGTVSEIADPMMQVRLQDITEQMGFGARAGNIEVRGSCAECRASGEKQEAGQ